MEWAKCSTSVSASSSLLKWNDWCQSSNRSLNYPEYLYSVQKCYAPSGDWGVIGRQIHNLRRFHWETFVSLLVIVGRDRLVAARHIYKGESLSIGWRVRRNSERWDWVRWRSIEVIVITFCRFLDRIDVLVGGDRAGVLSYGNDARIGRSGFCGDLASIRSSPLNYPFDRITVGSALQYSGHDLREFSSLKPLPSRNRYL
jgi:hypothetical protein